MMVKRSPTSPTMTTSIAKTLLNQRNEILQEWLHQQLMAENLRADLISEAELRTDSDRFLSVLTDAVQSGNFSKIESPEYQPVLELLERFSRSRGLQGFTPSETATFVFSLKQPLFSALRGVLSKGAAGPKFYLSNRCRPACPRLAEFFPYQHRRTNRFRNGSTNYSFRRSRC